MSMTDEALYVLQEAIKVSLQILQAAYCRSAGATKRLPVLEGFVEGPAYRSIRFASLRVQFATDCEFEVIGRVVCRLLRLSERAHKTDQLLIGLIRAGMCLHLTGKLRNPGQYAAEFGEAIERNLMGSPFRGDGVDEDVQVLVVLPGLFGEGRPLACAVSGLADGGRAWHGSASPGRAVGDRSPEAPPGSSRGARATSRPVA
jgi:hypothetical protein